MASFPQTSSQRKTVGVVPRLIGAVVLLALAFVFAGGIWLSSILRSNLPQLDGSLRVRGLSGPVKVSRDNHGVPTIEAATFDDLFFAQGFVITQDRLWQMDVMRRFAAGELAELLGPDLVPHDREQRILGLREAARKNFALVPPEVREHFEAYARGVNASMALQHDHLPIEFRILRYSPKLWAPEDSMLIAAQMVKDLSTPLQASLTREKILAKLGPELTADLYVNSSWHDRPPTVSKVSAEQDSDKDDSDDDDEDSSDNSVVRSVPPRLNLPEGEPSLREDGYVVGSNDWVVSGAHTVSGKPLLSDDMHLGYGVPNLWYEAHLRCADFDVAGVTLPGFPYVIVGHNQKIAWGFTNVGPTIEDAYIETFNATGQYLTPQGWRDPQHRMESIKVKGQPDVNVDVVLTRHGPIVSELYPGETRKVALRWTLYDGIRTPFFAVDSARDWNQFRAAFSQFDAPGQNVVYADVDGNIGYQTTGKIPIRAAGDGSLPVNGSDDAHEWTGYIPFEKLPNVYNPPGGIIATANGRITPDKYPYSISVEWEAPWRTARIYRVLESGKKFEPSDMLALQNDIVSEFDRFAAERFVYAIDHAKSVSARSKAAADILRSWDGRMSADSSAPTIVVLAERELTRLLLEPKLGAAIADEKTTGTLSWKSYRWLQDSVWMENILQHQPQRWLPTGYANYDELLSAAVQTAASQNDAPKDLAAWRWGSFHPLEIQHPILGKIPLLSHWSGPGVQPQSGSVYSVKAVSRDHGPSERFTADLSNFDQSTLNLVTGQSGNILSPWYMDQWKAWYEGFTFTLPFSQAAVSQAQTHQLTLQPVQ